MKYLLDTNVFFKIANDSEAGPYLLGRAVAAGKNRCYVSVVSVFEARAALDRRKVARPNLMRMAALLPRFRAMALPETASPYAARAVDCLLKAGIQRKDIDLLDCLIAGHAMARGYTLVTDNERHFMPIRGLTWVNWLKPK